MKRVRGGGWRPTLGRSHVAVPQLAKTHPRRARARSARRGGGRPARAQPPSLLYLSPPLYSGWQALQLNAPSIRPPAPPPFAAGDWIALGCAKLGQLLVWEWRSESYVFKQQGHYYDIAKLAWSPDGALIATGEGGWALPRVRGG